MLVYSLFHWRSTGKRTPARCYQKRRGLRMSSLLLIFSNSTFFYLLSAALSMSLKMQSMPYPGQDKSRLKMRNMYSNHANRSIKVVKHLYALHGTTELTSNGGLHVTMTKKKKRNF